MTSGYTKRTSVISTRMIVICDFHTYECDYDT
jgi:hypothetical protein